MEDHGTTHRHNTVLKIPHDTVIAPITENGVIKLATKKQKDKFYFKNEDIIETNVIQGKRNRSCDISTILCQSLI